MAVTRTTAAERRQREAAGLAGTLPGQRPAAVRNREAILLGGAAVAVLLGLFLAWKAVTAPLAATAAGLASGTVLNLNDLRQPEELVPLLDFLTEPTERMFVARQIWRRTQAGPVPNVGELAKIRVPASEVDKERRLPGLRERLAAARGQLVDNATDEGAEGMTVRLLTLAQLRALKPHLVVRTPAKFRSSFWLWTGLMIAAFLGIHIAWRVRRFPGDELILPMLLILTGIGLMVMICVRDPLRDLTLYSTFIQGVILGCVLLLAASQIDWERTPLRRMPYVPLLAALALSVLLITLGSGPAGSDAKVNLFGFQPVEAIKLLIVFFLAAYFFDRWEFLRELQERRLPGFLSRLGLPKMEYALPPILAMGAVLMFFFLQRDLGPALVMAFLFLILYCVARGLPVMLIVGSLVIGAGFYTGYQLGIPKTVTGRIQMWMSPWDNSFRGGDHLAQSLWSLAGGALTGTGLGLGDPGQVPAAHTDMVLAAIGEELGFLGLLAVFTLYAALVWRGIRTARRAGTTYGFFLALGLSVLTALHILLIAGGVVGLLPLSGVVSPFLSFGRSAMLANFLLCGILLALSARPGASDRPERGSLRGRRALDRHRPRRGRRRHPFARRAGAGVPGRQVPHPRRADGPGRRPAALPVQPAPGGDRRQHPARLDLRSQRPAARDQRSAGAGAPQGRSRRPGRGVRCRPAAGRAG